MPLSFRTLLRYSRSPLTLLHTLSTPAPPPQHPAAIARALHSISRHSGRSRRLPSWPRPYSSSPTGKPNAPTYKATGNPHTRPEPPLSLSARLRKLSREYGWSAIGVYFLLSALDFPFCFMAVRSLGAETVGHYEHLAVGYISAVIPEAVKRAWREAKEQVKDTFGGAGTRTGASGDAAGDRGERGQITTPVVAGEQGRVEAYGNVSSGGEFGIASGATGDYGKDVMEAEAMNRREDASIWTQLALAYAIHKSFIFVRVPLTVAVTPRVVKVLRGWGWDIGKRRPKEVREASKAARMAVKEAKKRKRS